VNREGAEVTSAGRAFQTRAPATKKARRPTVASLTAHASWGLRPPESDIANIFRANAKFWGQKPAVKNEKLYLLSKL